MSKQENKKKGNQAEIQAKLLLQSKGYKILATNLRLKFGEVDILAQDRHTLVIIEVKFKNSDQFGLAEEMITSHKKFKLIRLAQELARTYGFENVRIDVIANTNGQISHFINALEEE